MWMKKLEENRYKKVYNSDARRVAWMVNNEGVELSEMPKSMSKKWTKAQYGRERYLATEFVKSKSEQMNEGKLTEGFKKIAKKNVKYKDKTGTYNWQIESGIDTDVIGKGLNEQSNQVDNQTLIQINTALREHPVEKVGAKLRGYMSAMKKIV